MGIMKLFWIWIWAWFALYLCFKKSASLDMSSSNQITTPQTSPSSSILLIAFIMLETLRAETATRARLFTFSVFVCLLLLWELYFRLWGFMTWHNKKVIDFLPWNLMQYSILWLLHLELSIHCLICKPACMLKLIDCLGHDGH